MSATHEYSIAHFNQQTLIALTRNLSAIKESLHNVQALYCYEAETLRLQIDHYVQVITENRKLKKFFIKKNFQTSKYLNFYCSESV